MPLLVTIAVFENKSVQQIKTVEERNQCEENRKCNKTFFHL